MRSWTAASRAAAARPAPITIYRALDFLRDNGLVHRIESRNAFVACVNNHATGDLVVFLICEHCGAVGEAASAGGGRSAQGRGALGRLHAEGAGDRDRRRLRPLPAARSRLMSEVPASHTRPLDAASMVLVVLICLTWGFNQPAIKLAIHDVPPLTQCAIRSSAGDADRARPDAAARSAGRRPRRHARGRA